MKKIWSLPFCQIINLLLLNFTRNVIKNMTLANLMTSNRITKCRVAAICKIACPPGNSNPSPDIHTSHSTHVPLIPLLDTNLVFCMLAWNECSISILKVPKNNSNNFGIQNSHNHQKACAYISIRIRTNTHIQMLYLKYRRWFTDP